MLWAFVCRNCGRRYDLPTRDRLPCSCGHVLSRDYHSVNMGTVWHGQYHPGLGHYVSGIRDLGELAKRKAAEEMETTGIEASYVPVENARQAGIDPDQARDLKAHSAGRTRAVRQ